MKDYNLPALPQLAPHGPCLVSYLLLQLHPLGAKAGLHQDLVHLVGGEVEVGVVVGWSGGQRLAGTGQVVKLSPRHRLLREVVIEQVGQGRVGDSCTLAIL